MLQPLSDGIAGVSCHDGFCDFCDNLFVWVWISTHLFTGFAVTVFNYIESLTVTLLIKVEVNMYLMSVRSGLLGWSQTAHPLGLPAI